MNFSCTTENPTQTKKIGEILAKAILTPHHFEKNRHRRDKFSKTKISFANNKKTLQSGGGKRALVLGLEGDLGGGKTTFLQGFAKGLGIKEKITSPTFVIIKRFYVPYSIFHDFYHIDCYRIRKPKEIFNLGLKEIISNPRNIVAIEWADRIKKILPKNVLFLKFGFVGKTSRKIIIQSKNVQ